MKDGEANVGLIRHVTRRMDEFFDENPATEFADQANVIRAFARFLRVKDGGNQQTKQGNGMIVEEVPADEIFGEHSFTLAFIKLMDNGHVGVMWTPLLFGEPIAMPDELRDDLIELLRFHANKLEDRSLDQRMKKCTGTIRTA